MTPQWPADKPHIKVLDISDDPAAIARERARIGNRSVADYPLPGWYDLRELERAGLYRRDSRDSVAVISRS